MIQLVHECQVFSFLPSLADVEQVSHHPEQHLLDADGTIVICRHLVTNKVLALLCCQLLAFAEGIDVDKVVDVFAPAGTKLNYQTCSVLHQKLSVELACSVATIQDFIYFTS